MCGHLSSANDDASLKAPDQISQQMPKSRETTYRRGKSTMLEIHSLDKPYSKQSPRSKRSDTHLTGMMNSGLRVGTGVDGPLSNQKKLPSSRDSIRKHNPKILTEHDVKVVHRHRKDQGSLFAKK